MPNSTKEWEHLAPYRCKKAIAAFENWDKKEAMPRLGKSRRRRIFWDMLLDRSGF
ncbi:hypothetical protein [Laspinema olomoucense]|uniref:Uncharacterized protein n=1 Tax=Laspinema olomoucense D3b TaxID=2953688 RepID=A0ABT2N5M7_9CYAN|nr:MULTISPECIES: hypothetical protein [unclassified Laspinema]MCT7977882.1 hypothetical protein [Laspinema sp. D3b]MCT7994344.1 hypothetical protein [Laspinema sp. D3c]